MVIENLPFIKIFQIVGNTNIDRVLEIPAGNLFFLIFTLLHIYLSFK